MDRELNVIDEQIRQINEDLSADGYTLRLYRRGNRLHLRGNFPDRSTGEIKRGWYNLELVAVPRNLREAKAKAQSLSLDLERGKFRWPDDNRHESLDRLRVLERVETAFWTRGQGAKTTWRAIYNAHYAQLRNYPRLTTEILYKYCESKPPGSRARQTAITAMIFLCDVIGWPFDPDRVRSKVAPKPSKRVLPSDSEIEQMWESLSDNKEWQFAFGLMATFGLRNHEVFTIDIDRFQVSDEPFVEVTEGKTGRGRAYAFPIEWIDKFGLRDGELPLISGADNVQIGARATQFFRRRSLCRPYDLRHAYAVRMMVENVPIDVAAKFMRHSVRVHTQVYQAWFDEQRMEEVYQRMTKQD